MPKVTQEVIKIIMIFQLEKPDGCDVNYCAEPLFTPLPVPVPQSGTSKQCSFGNFISFSVLFLNSH